MFIPEFRIDNASSESFVDSNMARQNLLLNFL
jgi:hypothetical protein